MAAHVPTLTTHSLNYHCFYRPQLSVHFCACKYETQSYNRLG